MARRTSKLGNPHTDPLTRWAQRLSLGFFLVLTFALILFSKADTMLVERARMTAIDVLSPVLAAVAVPVHAARDGLAGLGDAIRVHGLNRDLVDENRSLREWRELARHLQVENARLRAELGHVDEAPGGFVTARVVADGSGAFARSVLINAGAREAIDRDQPVVAEGSLVGRIATVGSRSARVLLVTDLNSRIPVIVGAAGERAIAAGNNGPFLTLEYLSDGAAIAAGDHVRTSGHGGVFPPGLAVGTVRRVDTDRVTVEPLVDHGGLTHVRVLKVAPVIAPTDRGDDALTGLSVEAPAGAPTP